MKKAISRKHARQLQVCYMQTGFDREIIEGIYNRKEAIFDILAEREKLQERYDRYRDGMNICCHN